MRDPKRIRPILDRLEKVWNNVPDQRLGQLVNNSYAAITDAFYAEDDALVTQLEKKFLPQPIKLSADDLIEKGSGIAFGLCEVNVCDVVTGGLLALDKRSIRSEYIKIRHDDGSVSEFQYFYGVKSGKSWVIKIKM